METINFKTELLNRQKVVKLDRRNACAIKQPLRFRIANRLHKLIDNIFSRRL